MDSISIRKKMIKANAIGFEEVQKNLQAIVQQTEKRLQDEMVRSGYKVLADSQRTLKSNSKIAWGTLVRSGRVLVSTKNVKVEFAAEYASVVEFGRRAGKYPPVQPIRDWVKKKGIASDEKGIKSAGFLISRKIKEKGIKKSPFLYPAFAREKVAIMNRLKGIVR